MIQTVTQTRIIRDGTGTSSRIIITPVTSTRLIRDGGAQGATGTNGGGLTWSVATADTTMVANSGYVSEDAGHRVVFTLPTSFAVGDQFAIHGSSSGGWQINFNANQFATLVGVGVTQVGIASGIFSDVTTPKAFIYLFATKANLELTIVAVSGADFNFQ